MVGEAARVVMWQILGGWRQRRDGWAGAVLAVARMALGKAVIVFHKYLFLEKRCTAISHHRFQRSDCFMFA